MAVRSSSSYETDCHLKKGKQNVGMCRNRLTDVEHLNVDFVTLLIQQNSRGGENQHWTGKCQDKPN